jgi:hypothetical protein
MIFKARFITSCVRAVYVLLALVLVAPLALSQTVGETTDYISIKFPRAQVLVYKDVPRIEVNVNGTYTGVEFTRLYIVDDVDDAMMRRFDFYTADFSGGWSVKVKEGQDPDMGRFYHISTVKELTMISPQIYGPPETMDVRLTFDIYIAENNYSKGGYAVRNNEVRIDITLTAGKEFEGFIGIESNVYGSDANYRFSGVGDGWINYSDLMEQTLSNSVEVESGGYEFGYRWNEVCSGGNVISLYQRVGNELMVTFLYSSSLTIHHDPEIVSPVPFFMEVPEGGEGGAAEVATETVKEVQEHGASVATGVAVGVAIIAVSYIYLRRRP